MTTQTTSDFDVQNHGSLYLMHPLTDAARDWVYEHVHLEGWQWFGGGFAVEPRYLDRLLSGMCESGLRISS